MSADADYHPLGEDGLSEEERLKKYTGPVSHSALLPALKRGVVLEVRSELSLHEVGMALVKDDGSKVRQWMSQGLLARAEVDAFEVREGEEAYTALVVEPFVLVHLPAKG